MFTGLYTAIITPFRNGAIDYEAAEKNIEFQIASGIDGLVPVGTTGESPTVSFQEHKEFIKKVVQVVRGRVKVIAGTGSNSTEEAICLSRSAQDHGVDGILLVNPYYNKPTQNGLIQHFSKIAGSVTVPVVLYNIPGRTGVNFLPESIRELVKNSANIVAIKEASGDLSQMMRVMELCGNRLTLLSGDDNLLLPVLSIGGRGVISVLSNILPADVKKVITLYESGAIAEARAHFYRLLPLCRAMFLETNPIPVKRAMEMLGHCTSEIRLPLTPLGQENTEALRKAMREYGLKV
jgi:4-hydroxy-tetrahydrodipicolinate synthase